MIKRLIGSDIDLMAYSRCIKNSSQQNFYADPAVLDLNCERWELLVCGDYEYVMPVPVTVKFGFRFVAMPLFIQQLGIFGKDDDAQVNLLFYRKLLKNYAVQTYAFNERNSLDVVLPTRKNYVIAKQDYELLSRKGFKKGRKSDIKKISGLEMSSKMADIETFEFIQTHFKGLNKTDEIRSFVQFLRKYSRKLHFRHVYAGGKLVSLAVLTETDQSFGLLALINDENFKNLNASSFVINEFLKENIAEKALDFMGGNIRGIELFFKSFGAVMTTYPVIQHSRSALLKNLFKAKFLR